MLRVREMPIPSRRLKSGPAIAPVMASSPKPSLETARSATRSGIELPSANIVRPRKDVLIPLM